MTCAKCKKKQYGGMPTLNNKSQFITGALKNIIDKRKMTFYKRTDEYYDIFKSIISTLNEQYSMGTSLYYVKGSEAWLNILLNDLKISMYNGSTRLKSREIETRLSNNEYISGTFAPYEIVGLLPQNYDMDVYTTNANVYNVINGIYTKLLTVTTSDTYQKTVFNVVLSDNVPVKHDIIKHIKNDFRKKKYAPAQMEGIFKAYSISFCIDIKSFFGEMHDEKYMQFIDDSVCNSTNFNGYLMIYIKIHVVPDLLTFHNDFYSQITTKTDDNYISLNHRGLLFMSSLLSDSNRSHKILNVDNVRHKLFTKQQDHKFLSQQYAYLHKLFNNMYESWTNNDRGIFFGKYDVTNINHSLTKHILLNTLTDGRNQLEKTEFLIMDTLRSVINTIVVDIQLVISNIPNGGNECGVFIAGGDAFERYVFTGKTSDIDLKITIPLKYEKTNLIDTIRKALINTLSKHIVFLNVDYDCRLRYFNGLMPRKKGHTNLTSPFDLYSIDLKTHINDGGYTYKYEYAIFDAAIGYYDVNMETDIIKNTVTFSQKPEFNITTTPEEQGKFEYIRLHIASPTFLLRDLESTYNTPSKYLVRIYNNKVNKDIVRYNSLKQTRTNRTFDGYNTVSLQYIARLYTDINKYTARIDNYKREFYERLKINKHDKIVKTKMDYLGVTKRLISMTTDERPFKKRR